LILITEYKINVIKITVEKMTYEEKKIKIIEKIQDSEYTPTTEQLEELFNLGFGQGIKVGLLHFRDKILKEFSGIDKSKMEQFLPRTMLIENVLNRIEQTFMGYVNDIDKEMGI